MVLSLHRYGRCAGCAVRDVDIRQQQQQQGPLAGGLVLAGVWQPTECVRTWVRDGRQEVRVNPSRRLHVACFLACCSCCSSYYPGTGAATDIGVGRGRGRTINVAWSPPIVADKRGRRVQVRGGVRCVGVGVLAHGVLRAVCWLWPYPSTLVRQGSEGAEASQGSMEPTGSQLCHVMQ